MLSDQLEAIETYPNFPTKGILFKVDSHPKGSRSFQEINQRDV